MDIHERIKEVRVESKLTLEKFGEKIGMAKSSISRLEKGERSVAERTLKLIGSEFGINEEWLKTGQGKKYKATFDDEELMNIVTEACRNDNEEVKRAIKTIAKLNDEQLDILLQFMEILQKTSQ